MEEVKLGDIKYLDEVPLENIKYLDEQSPKSALESLGETASDFARGAVSGLTFGGVEELAAGGKAALESLGSTKDESLENLYRKYLEIEEKKTKEAEERSPVATTLGEVGGAILPAFFSGGASMAATGGTAVGKLAGMELAKAAGKAALVQGALGAGGGALSGGLSSEGKLIGATEEEKAKLLEDVKSGALSGGVLGGVIGGALPYASKYGGKLVDWAKEGAEDTVFGKQLRTAFETGERGEGFTRATSLTKRQNEITQGIEDVVDVFEDVRKKAGSKISQTLEVADDAGVTLSVPSEIMNELSAALENTKAKSLISEIEDSVVNKIPGKTVTKLEMNPDTLILEPRTIKQPDVVVPKSLTPSQLYDLRKKLKEEIIKRDPDSYSAVKKIIDKLDDKIESAFSDNPALKDQLDEMGLASSYKGAMKNYTSILDALHETVIGEGRRTAERGAFYGDLTYERKSLVDKMGSFLSDLYQPGQSSKEAIRTLRSESGGLLSKLRAIENDPEASKVMDSVVREMGFDGIQDFSKKLTSKIEDVAEKSSTLKAIRGETASESVFGKYILSPTRTGILQGAAASGRAVTGVKGAMSKFAPANISKVLYSLPETQLGKVADRMLQDPALSKYGKNLASALAAGDTVKKDAALFLLMQNPKIRDFIPDLISDEEEE